MPVHDLRDYPHHLDTLASWHQKEWAHLNPGQTLEQRIFKMQDYLKPDFIPSTFIYLRDGKLCGSAAIIESDMDTHTELRPWLASVYVSPNERRQGIGQILVESVMERARHNDISTLYLYTPDQADFYQKLGWRAIADESYHDTPVTIMSVRLV